MVYIDTAPLLRISTSAQFTENCMADAWKYFGQRPSVTEYSGTFYAEKFWNWIKTEYDAEKKDATVFRSVELLEDGTLSSTTSYFLLLSKKFFVSFVEFEMDEDEGYNTICSATQILSKANDPTEESIFEFLNKLVSFEMNQAIDNSSRFFLISMSNGNYRLMPSVANKVEIDFKANYGAGFKTKATKILKAFKEDSKGLVLLYGGHGMGKSYFIRYLIGELADNKTIIYLPAHMMNHICTPEFMMFMNTLGNTLLIIEDAENILAKRGSNYNEQGISNVLNMADGILNDAFKIQLLLTFNTEKTAIDPALLRPGRLIEEHSFGKLSAEDATALSKKLKKKIVYTEPKSLAEVYVGDDVHNKKMEKIGF